MDCTTNTFYSLLAEAARLLHEIPAAEQVTVVETAKGSIYHCINHAVLGGDTSAEDAFAEMLQSRNDTTVCCLVAVWNRLTVDCIQSKLHPVDLPSFHLRQKLLELSAENAKTRILLLGNDGYGYKPLGATMPSPPVG